MTYMYRRLIFTSCAAAAAASSIVQLTSVHGFESFVDAHETVLLGLFSPCGEACQAFKSLRSTGHRGLALAAAYGPVAGEISDDIDFGDEPVWSEFDHEHAVVEESRRRCASPDVCEVILFPDFTAAPLHYNGSWALHEMVEWARRSRYPAVHPLTHATHRSLVQKSGRAVLWLFVELHPAGLETESALAAAQRCAAVHASQLGALYAQGDSPSGRLLQRTVGLDGDAPLPALAIQAASGAGGGSPRSFVYPAGAPLEPAEVDAFCRDFASGALERAEAETGEGEGEGEGEAASARSASTQRNASAGEVEAAKGEL